MGLLQDVHNICNRLGPLGWQGLLLSITNNELDIMRPSAEALGDALVLPVTSIDRSRVGFEDYSDTGNQGITGGSPSLSLLYHALASPGVHPTADGDPSSDPQAYPSLTELDTIENYIYSLVFDRADLTDTFVAVFAYQYRVLSRTSHLRHADMTYSRTGVARVGTARSNYDSSRRSFWSLPANGSEAISVLPARYGAFLARRTKPGFGGSVQGGHQGQNDADFIFPIHKLFEGPECLKGMDLRLEFHEFHRNEKLRKIHTLPVRKGGIEPPEGFDLTKPPYVRDSLNGGALVDLVSVGSTTLVVPTPADTLVRIASQLNTDTSRDQIAYFIVPRSGRITKSTLAIPPDQQGVRQAPEYVSIRHEIDPDDQPNQVPKDINLTPDKQEFLRKVRIGGYPAAHFVDDSCDGCVEVSISGLPIVPENLPAFSLVTAPDFLPLADQIEVNNTGTVIRTSPLSEGRLPVNPVLPRRSDRSVAAFPDRNDETVTAVVGESANGFFTTGILGHPNRAISFLPDAASNVFAPGWDTSRGGDDIGEFLTSTGLGALCREGVKLCAALASFWPAAAPDNGRTFGNDDNSGIGVRLDNQVPMLDEELGFHPEHPSVLAGEVESFRGWDGEFGPFFEVHLANRFVNFSDITRSDYVSHALKGRIKLSTTAHVQSEDLIARQDAINRCQRAASISDLFNNFTLVVFRQIEDWNVVGNAFPNVTSNGFLLEFAKLEFGDSELTTDIFRVRKKITQHLVFQVGSNGVAFQIDGGNPRFGNA